MRPLLVATSLTLLLACAPAVTQQDYAAYRQLYYPSNSLQPRAIVLDTLACWRPGALDSFLPAELAAARLQPGTIADFVANNEHVHTLRPKPLSRSVAPDSVALLSRLRLPPLTSADTLADSPFWASLSARYEIAPSIQRRARAGVSPDSTEILVYYEARYGPRSLVADWLVLTLSDGAWLSRYRAPVSHEILRRSWLCIRRPVG